MMIHLLRITAVIAGVILCTLLPFLPGRYDSLAAPLSAMSQIFGKVGLLLAPVGAIWMTSERWSRRAGKQYVFARTAMIASFPVCLAVLLGAITHGGLSFGVAAMALYAYVVLRMAPRLGRWAGEMTESAGAIPLYLFIAPVAVALLQTAIASPATEFSRSRAIRNSERLIADIEQYRAVNGRYPSSLLSVNKDYSPSIIGIKEFHYEPSGDAYNLSFEQFKFQPDTREIVMYNPRDQHVMTSNDMDLLQITPGELALRRGYYAVHGALNPHWKYIWFHLKGAKSPAS